MSSKTRFTLLALALLATAPMALEAQAKANRPIEARSKALFGANNNSFRGNRGNDGGMLSIGGTQNSSLDNSDLTDDGTPAELWAIDLKAGDIIMVTMTSSAFDTQIGLLEMRDDEVSVIANDDALPGTTNSAIVFRSDKDQSVAIIATSYGTSGRGSYSIQVARLRQP